MTLTGRTRLAKRKQEIQEVRKEHQTATSKKHDRGCLGKEKNSVNDLMLQFKSLQEVHDNLVKENNNNLIMIKELKETIVLMESEKTVKKDNKSEETQTESEYTDFPCQECVYVASCIEELNWHLENEHNHEEAEELDFNNHLNCNICGKRNANNGELMTHRKNSHPETIKTCKYFVKGKCGFPESVCWFNHKIRETNSATLTPQTLMQFHCGFCKKIFTNKSDFMKHRVREHEEYVPECRNNLNGCCTFSAKECWFKHESSTENQELESPEIVKRLFEMMEKFTERIEQLERQLYNQTNLKMSESDIQL